MRPRARHAIVFRNSFVKCGGDIEEPGGFELGGTGPFAFTNVAGEVGQVLEKKVKVFA